MRNQFEGWYYKHQAKENTIAFIPGRAQDHAFIQVVTDNRAYNIRYPLSVYQTQGKMLRVGGSTFSDTGVSLEIEHPELRLAGDIQYSGLSPIRGDIMGPFRFFPMECRHGIISMKHALQGRVFLNGEKYDFTDGVGYIESDSGRSFPNGYTWVQCSNFVEDCSIMAAVARIPFYGLKFWGCICIVHLNGREYRLATYNGGKILTCKPGRIELIRGKYHLTVTVNPKNGHKLPAPRFGRMEHIIQECLSCHAEFRFAEGNRVLFTGKSNQASYECEMP